jgi:ATP-binding cassette subfamily B protein
MRRLVGELRQERLLLTLVVVLSVASVAFAVVGPKILGNATNILFEGVVNEQIPAGVSKAEAIAGLRAEGQDRVADMISGMPLDPGQGIDFEDLARTLGLLAGVYLLSAVFQWMQSYLMAGIAQRTIYRLRRQADEKLARLPLKYFDDHPRGDVLSRMTNDIDNISQSLQQSLTQIITSALTIVGVLIMMLTISWLLALISVLVVPVSVVITVLIAKRSQKQFARQWQSTGDLNGHVEEMFTGHNVVKVFGRQDKAIATFDEQNDELYQASFKAQFISGIIMPVMNSVMNLNYVAIAVVGGLMIATGRISLGDVQAFIQYSRQFTMPITQVAGVMNVLQSTAASAERIFELLDEPEEAPDPAACVAFEHTSGHIQLEGVSFRYLPDTPLITGLTLDLDPGDTVAIVGPTGAGKTTLVNLLLRFYDIDEGRILVDGVETRDMSRSDLRRLFGMVLQDTWLFSGSIRDNIAYGREGATEEEIRAAARAARVDHFVRALPDGYDTVLDDDATNVSQGERQLLTIARAFLADPDILILDEATSSVDTRTEVLIQQAMAELMKDRTSFVIAHRLSTIRGADIILVMDKGAIIEQGSHEELMAAHGFYHDLYASQFEEALDEAS